jgi:hypothetical protein
MIDWQVVKSEFEWDGSFRDIYITSATLDDWQTIYPFLLECPGASLSRDGVTRSPPRTIESLFAESDRPSSLLSVHAGRVQVNFHFFTQDEIECDIDPCELKSQTDLDALLVFVRELGDRTHKATVISHENQPEAAIISYDPRTGDFKYHPPSYS